MEAKRTNRDGGVSLPEDVVFEVLARLPAKTLCRFRCVCKGWCALIGNPAFVAAQRSRAGPHLVGVLHKAFPPQMLVMDMDGNMVRASEMTTMCTRTPLPTQPDLICVDEEQLSPQAGGAMVIDPAAGRAYTVFSKSDPPTPWGFTCSTSFGRATPSGAFKFIRLQEPCWHDDDGGHVLCKVATITDGGGTGPPTWRRRSAPPFVTGSGRDQKVVVNGCLYCISCKLKFGGDVHGEDDTAPCWNRIAAFDLESEEWKAEVINGPKLMRHHKEEEIWCIALVEIKGTLAVVDAHVDNQDVTIWLLVDPEKSVWVKECRIQVPGNLILTTKLLGDVLGDKRLLLLVQRIEEETRQNKTGSHVGDSLVFYNPSTKAFTDLFRCRSDLLDIYWSFYTGSLLSCS